MMMVDTNTRNKRKIIGLLILVVTVGVVAAYVIHHYRRVNARAEADRIIAGEQQATPEQISEITHKLYSVRVAWQTRWQYIKYFMEDLTPLDRQRNKRLHEIRAEMRKSHGLPLRAPFDPNWFEVQRKSRVGHRDIERKNR